MGRKGCGAHAVLAGSLPAWLLACFGCAGDQHSDALIPGAAERDTGVFSPVKQAAEDAAGDYWECVERVAGRWPSPEEAAELRGKARECTLAYERALKECQDALARLALAAEWSVLNAHSYYEADSRMMRAGCVVPVLTSERSRELDFELATLKSAAAAEIASSSCCRHLSDTLKDRLLNEIAKQYRFLGRFPIPESHFRAILADLPLFLDIGVPLDAFSGPESLGDTIQWCFWVAITLPLPRSDDRAIIDEQVTAFARHLDRSFAEAVGRLQLGKIAFDPARAFRAAYDRTKNNRFFPFFKRTLTARQQDRINKQYDKLLADTTSQFAKFASGAEVGKEAPSAGRRDSLQKSLAEALTVNMWSACTYYDRPGGRRQLPEQAIEHSRGTLNEFNVYVFSVLRAKPFPPFPVAKCLTADEAENRRLAQVRESHADVPNAP